MSFTRDELIAVRERSGSAARVPGLAPAWARAYLALADAADRLDAMHARTIVVGATGETYCAPGAPAQPPLLGGPGVLRGGVRPPSSGAPAMPAPDGQRRILDQVREQMAMKAGEPWRFESDGSPAADAPPADAPPDDVSPVDVPGVRQVGGQFGGQVAAPGVGPGTPGDGGCPK